MGSEVLSQYLFHLELMEQLFIKVQLLLVRNLL
jgi:hypothetical protein